MGAIIKLGSNPAKLGIPGSAREFVTPTNNLMGLRIKHGKVVAVGGKQDGTTITDGVVEANQQVLIYPAVALDPMKYQTLISVNPLLLTMGMVSHPNIVEPGEGELIFVAFKAGRKTELKEVLESHLFTLYMVD